MTENTGVTGMVLMRNNSSLALRLRSGLGTLVSSVRRHLALGMLVVVFRMLSGVEACAASDTTFWKPPVFTRLDSLFIISATGEPKYQPQRDSSQKVLLALDTVALRYLLDHRLTGQTPRQRHYVETFFALASDSGRNANPRRLLAQALTISPDTIRSQLLYIGSEMHDTAFRREAIPYLHSDSAGVRRMAVRCLGSYPNPENLPMLWDGLEKTHGLELQERLWALNAQGPLQDWKKLIPLMSDSLFFNRQKIRDMLLKSTDSSWIKLQTAIPLKMDATERLEWCLLALDAKGSEGFLDSAMKLLTDEERKLLSQYDKSKKYF